MSKAIEKNCHRLYGCDLSEALATNDGLPLRTPGSMAAAYDKQRHNAARRGVEWLISFPQWAAIWKHSGKWDQRGKSASSFCMARHGDMGPYSPTNVSIQPVTKNNGDARAIAALVNDYSAIAKSKKGSGRGWTFVGHKSSRRPYQVCVSSRYVGSFATQAEAEAAYAAAL